MLPILTHRESSSGPVAPIPTVHTRCSGWSCLSDAEQFGILFSIIVTATILGIVYICFLRSRKADREVALELFHVRYPRVPRRPRAVSVPVILPPPPAYQPVQVPYAYSTYAPPGHVVAPPGATVQTYAIPSGGTASAMYSPVDGGQRPPTFHTPGPTSVPYGTQQPAQQVPIAGVPLDAYNSLPQRGGYTPAGGYGQGPWPDAWHAGNRVPDEPAPRLIAKSALPVVLAPKSPRSAISQKIQTW
ncbi:uncharacterized protein DNG_05499 [Cephalotrichum gorgonifer]|uniref:Uncharacterized protein n=1 Tax=Cephalotrichum gorgonifer TaxID=2041049 RepID=A0AAE8MZS7_9PEZI|nr:uncharacterized protein DNG_05499 [Cephalotrichum gorgonifer]